jgi:hypothetical protein
MGGGTPNSSAGGYIGGTPSNQGLALFGLRLARKSLFKFIRLILLHQVA